MQNQEHPRSGWTVIEAGEIRPACDRCHRVRVKIRRGTVCEGCRQEFIAELQARIYPEYPQPITMRHLREVERLQHAL